MNVLGDFQASLHQNSGLYKMTAKEIVNKYLGKKYVNNGRDLAVGLDCWGLLMAVTDDIFGVKIPDYTYDWRYLVVTHERIFDKFDLSQWVYKVKLENIKFGDYILIEAIDDLPLHVGIFMQDDKFIHAVSTLGVVVESVNIIRGKITGVYRLKNDQSRCQA